MIDPERFDLYWEIWWSKQFPKSFPNGSSWQADARYLYEREAHVEKLIARYEDYLTKMQERKGELTRPQEMGIMHQLLYPQVRYHELVRATKAYVDQTGCDLVEYSDLYAILYPRKVIPPYLNKDDVAEILMALSLSQVTPNLYQDGTFAYSVELLQKAFGFHGLVD